MKEDYIIRRAKAEDARGIHKVILSAFKEYRQIYTVQGFADTVMSEEVAIERMKEMILYIAVNQEINIIGTIGWQKVSEKEGHIRGMAVLPKMQGKNSPASALLHTVENDAKLQGCTCLTLDTTASLKRAHYFYKKYGYIETGITDDFFGSTIFEYKKNLDQ